MVITLYSITYGITNSIIPDIPCGKTSLFYCDHHGKEKLLLNLKEMEGIWHISSSCNAMLIDSSHGFINGYAPLWPNGQYRAKLKRNGVLITLLVEDTAFEKRKFDIYNVLDTIAIGRNETCDIQSDNPYVSNLHARIAVHDKSLMLEDLNSTNGTFLNGISIRGKKTLQVGDVIRIFGITIIVLNQQIAVKAVNGNLRIKEKTCHRFTLQTDPPSIEPRIELDPSPFLRTPRLRFSLETLDMEVEAPPVAEKKETLPPALAMGSSLAMGFASLCLIAVTLIGSTQHTQASSNWLPSIIMSFSMLATSVMFPVLMRNFNKKSDATKALHTQKAYGAYINHARKRIQAHILSQEKILRSTYPEPSALLAALQERSRKIWERSITHEDFLSIRIGEGSFPMQASIQFPPHKFHVEEDKLLALAYKLEAEERVLKHVPILLDMKKDPVCGFIGNKDILQNYVSAFLLNLCATHSPDEVKLVFLYDKSQRLKWQYVNMLPHTWSQDHSFRFVATTGDEVNQLAAVLQTTLSTKKGERAALSYMLLILSPQLFKRSALMQEMVSKQEYPDLYLAAFSETLQELPRECKTIISINSNISKIVRNTDAIEQINDFYADSLDNSALPQYAKLLYRLVAFKERAQSASFPAMLTFMDMFHCAQPVQLNVMRRWRQSDPVHTLAVPVGVNQYGEPLILDIHQSAHGPHGLIAGMTGSGKSEFIITYLLSLALHYSPLEVGFLLIDYKGGGMSDTLKKLPHVVGTIDNLGGKQGIRRSMTSIESELSRRQLIFKETSERLGLNNLDIYKYQQLYREGSVDEPLQHLLLISDEFAELKQQEPDFLDCLVSAARIGRSLGIHLILATQKPAGIVTDQIWSNTRFRVCLKVQDRNDSIDMLKRPDAALLTHTGRFYMQVGFDEIFVLGQSAWSGAKLSQDEQYTENVDRDLEILNPLGQSVYRVKIKDVNDVGDDTHKKGTQVDNVIKYIFHEANAARLLPRPLWLPVLPASLTFRDMEDAYDTSEESYFLNPAIGIVDQPSAQKQFLLRVPFSSDGNALLYGMPGSGKTQFVNAIIMALCKHHHPEEVNLYIIDFASEASRMFSQMPHVGDVLVLGEDEKIHNLFKMLTEEIALRRQRLSAYSGSQTVYHEQTGKHLTSILVIVHNYPAFVEEFSEYEDVIFKLSREGIRYGIFFLITATSYSSVRHRLTQNFKQVFCLQMNDTTDYTMLLAKTNGVYPLSRCGSGVCLHERQVLEFQIADLFEKSGVNPVDLVRQMAQEMKKSFAHVEAARIRTLPALISLNMLCEDTQSISLGAIPLGMDRDTVMPVTFDFTQRFIHVCLFSDPAVQPYVSIFGELFSLSGAYTVYAIDMLSFLKKTDGMHYACDLSSAKTLIDTMLEIVHQRYKESTLAQRAGTEKPTYPPCVFLLCGMTDLLEQLDSESIDKLDTLLLFGESALYLTVVLIQNVRKATSLSIKEWHAKHVSMRDGLWFGTGFDSQYAFDISKRIRHGLGNDFSYVITAGTASAYKPISTL